MKYWNIYRNELKKRRTQHKEPKRDNNTQQTEHNDIK